MNSTAPGGALPTYLRAGVVQQDPPVRASPEVVLQPASVHPLSPSTHPLEPVSVADSTYSATPVSGGGASKGKTGHKGRAAEHVLPPSTDKDLVQALGRFFKNNIPQPRATKYDPREVPEGLEGLRALSDFGYWRSVVQQAQSSLKEHKKNPKSLLPHEALEVQAYLIAGLLKLCKYEQAALWSKNVALDDQRYENFPDLYPGKTGSLVPFRLETLLCELPHYTQQNTAATVARLFKLRSRIDEEMEQDAVDRAIHEARYKHITLKLASLYLNMPSPNLPCAVQLIAKLAARFPSNPILYSLLGRVFLQYGDVARAKKAFELAETRGDMETAAHHVQVEINRCLLHVVDNDFKAALGRLEELLTVAPGNDVVVNNHAVCSLYTNDIAKAVSSVEDLIRVDPLTHTSPPVVANVKALWEISSPNAGAKKRLLEGLLHLYAADDLQEVRRGIA